MNKIAVQYGEYQLDILLPDTLHNRPYYTPVYTYSLPGRNLGLEILYSSERTWYQEYPTPGKDLGPKINYPNPAEQQNNSRL